MEKVLISWDQNQYGLGITLIDDQHKRLVDIINKLFNALLLGKADNTVPETLKELIDYTNYHFKAEEDLFHIYYYPKTNEHEFEHNQFLTKMYELMEKSKTNVNVVSFELMQYLKDWLLNHILVSDRKYVPFMKAKGL